MYVNHKKLVNIQIYAVLPTSHYTTPRLTSWIQWEKGGIFAPSRRSCTWSEGYHDLSSQQMAQVQSMGDVCQKREPAQ
jgi:hypothetical protein